MRVAVVHNEVLPNASSDDRDVLVQVEQVTAALARLGHDAHVLACTLDLNALQQQLKRLSPHVVFNLVESLNGTERLTHVAAALFDALRFPYTGSPAEAMLLSSHKLLAKERLLQAGLPTPNWMTLRHSSNGTPLQAPYIVKSVWEHGSYGLDDAAVVMQDQALSVAEMLRERQRQWKGPVFAEAFIAGREFNLSLLAQGREPQVLPPAEIDFSSFPPGKPHIVGYRAKWDEASFEYQKTPLRFAFDLPSRTLLNELILLAEKCWALFGLRGYARVDFRVNGAGRPLILEVNSNPCLSPDAGFAAALAQAGIAYEVAIQRILDEALTEAEA